MRVLSLLTSNELRPFAPGLPRAGWNPAPTMAVATRRDTHVQHDRMAG